MESGQVAVPHGVMFCLFSAFFSVVVVVVLPSFLCRVGPVCCLPMLRLLGFGFVHALSRYLGNCIFSCILFAFSFGGGRREAC